MWRVALQRQISMQKRNRLSRACPFTAVSALITPLVFMTGSLLFGQAGNDSSRPLESGEQIYKSACIACHGSDATGTPKSISGFQPPRTFPDFTKCDQTTPEANSAWKAVITHGGPTRGLSQNMPSFGDAPTSEQLDTVIKYFDSFCPHPPRPPGRLNLPRAPQSANA